MKTQQIKFIDEEGSVLGGILIDDEYIVCGCCGGILEVKEVEIIKYYNDWVNISEEIIGE